MPGLCDWTGQDRIDCRQLFAEFIPSQVCYHPMAHVQWDAPYSRNGPVASPPSPLRTRCLRSRRCPTLRASSLKSRFANGAHPKEASAPSKTARARCRPTLSRLRADERVEHRCLPGCLETSFITLTPKVWGLKRVQRPCSIRCSPTPRHLGTGRPHEFVDCTKRTGPVPITKAQRNEGSRPFGSEQAPTEVQ